MVPSTEAATSGVLMSLVALASRNSTSLRVGLVGVGGGREGGRGRGRRVRREGSREGLGRRGKDETHDSNERSPSYEIHSPEPAALNLMVAVHARSAVSDSLSSLSPLLGRGTHGIQPP